MILHNVPHPHLHNLKRLQSASPSELRGADKRRKSGRLKQSFTSTATNHSVAPSDICPLVILIRITLTHQAHPGVCLHLFIHSFPQSLPHQFLLRYCMCLGDASSCTADVQLMSLTPLLHLVCVFHPLAYAALLLSRMLDKSSKRDETIKKGVFAHLMGMQDAGDC